MNYKKSFLLMIISGLLLSVLILPTSISASSYRVEQGDTFWNLSKRYDVKLNDLIDINPHIKDPDMIFPGDKIYLQKQNLNSRISRLLGLINSERERLGINPLIIDDRLNKAARLKAEDMKRYKYVAHKSPTYGNPTLMLKALNIPFKHVHENIGTGHEKPKDIFTIWMNSSIHRENLLNEQTSKIGIGYAQGGLHGHYWIILMVEK